MKKLLPFFAGIAGIVFSAAAAEENAAAPPRTLVELYTSQGCYSCPPAEKILAEDIAVLPNVTALEFHVDYWDDLVYGGSVWADPFSDRAYTQRQTAYNSRLRNTRSVFTPQAVIHGRRQAGGTQKSRILEAIEESAQLSPVRFRFNGRQVRAEGALPPGARLFYAVFWRKKTTEITAGENKGKTLVNTNVVASLKHFPFGVREANLPELEEGQGCAVWLQQGRIGGVLGAADCPL